MSFFDIITDVKLTKHKLAENDGIVESDQSKLDGKESQISSSVLSDVLLKRKCIVTANFDLSHFIRQESENRLIGSSSSMKYWKDSQISWVFSCSGILPEYILPDSLDFDGVWIDTHDFKNEHKNVIIRWKEAFMSCLQQFFSKSINSVYVLHNEAANQEISMKSMFMNSHSTLLNVMFYRRTQTQDESNGGDNDMVCIATGVTSKLLERCNKMSLDYLILENDSMIDLNTLNTKTSKSTTEISNYIQKGKTLVISTPYHIRLFAHIINEEIFHVAIKSYKKQNNFMFPDIVCQSPFTHAVPTSLKLTKIDCRAVFDIQDTDNNYDNYIDENNANIANMIDINLDTNHTDNSTTQLYMSNKVHTLTYEGYIFNTMIPILLHTINDICHSTCASRRKSKRNHDITSVLLSQSSIPSVSQQSSSENTIVSIKDIHAHVTNDDNINDHNSRYSILRKYKIDINNQSHMINGNGNTNMKDGSTTNRGVQVIESNTANILKQKKISEKKKYQIPFAIQSHKISNTTTKTTTTTTSKSTTPITTTTSTIPTASKRSHQIRSAASIITRSDIHVHAMSAIHHKNDQYSPENYNNSNSIHVASNRRYNFYCSITFEANHSMESIFNIYSYFLTQKRKNWPILHVSDYNFYQTFIPDIHKVSYIEGMNYITHVQLYPTISPSPSSSSSSKVKSMENGYHTQDSISSSNNNILNNDVSSSSNSSSSSSSSDNSKDMELLSYELTYEKIKPVKLIYPQQSSHIE